METRAPRFSFAGWRIQAGGWKQGLFACNLLDGGCRMEDEDKSFSLRTSWMEDVGWEMETRDVCFFLFC